MNRQPSGDVARDAAVSQAHVLGVAADLLGRLASVGTFGTAPRGGWSGCDDLGGQVAYRVSGRIDARDRSADGFLAAAGRSLAGAGVHLHETAGGSGPATTLQGSRERVLVQLTGYAREPVVVVSLTGPCLEVGAADDDLLAEPPLRLTLR